MPLVIVHTNLKESQLKDGTELRIGQIVGGLLDKPIERMVVVIVPGVRVLRDGTTDPAVVVNIHGVEVFDAEKNPRYGPIIRQLLKDEFGVEANRTTTLYHDLEFSNIG